MAFQHDQIEWSHSITHLSGPFFALKYMLTIVNDNKF